MSGFEEQGVLFRYAYLVIGDRGHAEDLIQEALTKTYMRWHRLRDSANAEAYTRRVITAVSWFRRKGWGERPRDDIPAVARPPRGRGCGRITAAGAVYAITGSGAAKQIGSGATSGILTAGQYGNLVGGVDTSDRKHPQEFVLYDVAARRELVRTAVGNDLAIDADVNATSPRSFDGWSANVSPSGRYLLTDKADEGTFFAAGFRGDEAAPVDLVSCSAASRNCSEVVKEIAASSGPPLTFGCRWGIPCSDPGGSAITTRSTLGVALGGRWPVRVVTAAGLVVTMGGPARGAGSDQGRAAGGVMGSGKRARGGELSARIAAAMTSAQSGGHASAAAEIEAIRAELNGVPSYHLAAAEYVRGVAAHNASDADEALRAVAACIEVARAIDEPGWEANALPVRIINLARSGRGGDTINDLVAAEAALSRTRDAGLTAWAHTGLGYAYDVLRLFELCIPHYELATQLTDDVFDLYESEAIDRLNLAETYLRWAHELERLGDPSYTREIEERLASAAYWAREAERVLVDDETQEFWRLSARLWLAAAATGEDPEQAAAELTEIRDEICKLGETERLAIAGAYLARALQARGKSEEARAAADRAAADLIPLADPATHLLVLQTRTEIAAAEGEPGALTGLQYARSVARSWWKERQRGLNAVRHALSAHDLSARHDAEWHAARQDPLTGVGNRRALDERLTAARDSGRAVTLLAIDVDNLKIVNDTHGHACGDELLQVVANLLVEQARATDAVIRSGGDEFFVVLDQPDAKGGAQLAERIRTAVRAIAAATEKPWLRRLGLSIGYAATAEGVGVEQLIATADQRLYGDKRRKKVTGAANG